jgi:hypothetical protein
MKRLLVVPQFGDTRFKALSYVLNILQCVNFSPHLDCSSLKLLCSFCFENSLRQLVKHFYNFLFSSLILMFNNLFLGPVVVLRWLRQGLPHVLPCATSSHTARRLLELPVMSYRIPHQVILHLPLGRTSPSLVPPEVPFTPPKTLYWFSFSFFFIYILILYSFRRRTSLFSYIL